MTKTSSPKVEEDVDEGDPLDSVSPIAYAPKTLRVPAWSEAILWVRVPAAGTAGQTLCVLPLEDSRVDDLR
eukprot:17709-Prymnesium_polylepis.1